LIVVSVYEASAHWVVASRAAVSRLRDRRVTSSPRREIKEAARGISFLSYAGAPWVISRVPRIVGTVIDGVMVNVSPAPGAPVNAEAAVISPFV